MGNFAQDLHIFLKSQSVLAQARIKLALRQGLFLVLALIAAGLGLVMLNTAAFLVIATYWGYAGAAFAVALGDLVLCFILLMIAANQKETPNIVQAKEMGARAAQALRSDIENIQNQVQSARDDIVGLRERFWSTVRKPFDTTLLAMAFPLLSAVLRMLLKQIKRRKKEHHN